MLPGGFVGGGRHGDELAVEGFGGEGVGELVVVATDVAEGDVGEFLDGGTGLLVEGFEARAVDLAEALHLANEDLGIGDDFEVGEV